MDLWRKPWSWRPFTGLNYEEEKGTWMSEPGVWAACANEWAVQMSIQRDAEQWGWGPWKHEHHGEKRNRKRRELGGMHVPVRWDDWHYVAACLDHICSNIRNCRNHLPENSMLENVRLTNASCKHTGILDPTFLSNKTSEPSTVFQDAIFLGFLPLQFWNLFPMFTFVKVILYLLRRQWSLHTFC